MNNDIEILNELKNRGIFNNISNDKKFDKYVDNSEKIGAYIGFDPTAESLHLGNYIQIMTLLRFQKFGFNSVAVLGGATGMIGDPSGKSDERNLLDNDRILKNKQAIREQLESFGLTVIDNLTFYENMNVLDFMRNVGKMLNVQYMINKDIVKSRLGEDKAGISFTEFSYQLIQGWDFKKLYEEHNVSVQLGGSDQWGNITAGLEIIRKAKGVDNNAVGITTNLLTTSSGEKFGKSAGNALFLDRNLTSPFSIYQYLINTPDTDVEKLLNWLTFIDTEEITKIVTEHNKEPFKRIGQKKLASSVILDIYDDEELSKIKAIADALFGKGSISDISDDDKRQLIGFLPYIKTEQSSLMKSLVKVEAIKSEREGKEFFANGAIYIDGNKITDIEYEISNGLHIVRCGKKKFYVIEKI